MLHTATLVASITALVCAMALYSIQLRPRHGGGDLSEFCGSLLLALLTGLMPMAIAGCLVGLWSVFRGGASLSALMSGGLDLVSLAGVVATGLVLRALVKATYRGGATPGKVTPFTPRPVAPQRTSPRMKRAA